MTDNWQIKHPSRLQPGDCIVRGLPGRPMPIGAKIVAIAKEGNLWRCTCVSVNNQSYEFEFNNSDVVTVDLS